jgi:hypothetical protein
MMEPVEAPKNETTYVGRAQVNFFQIKHLILAMQLWHRTGMKPIGHATVSGTNAVRRSLKSSRTCTKSSGKR